MKFSDFDLGKCSDGLLPVVIQDNASLKVLMLGYMNEEAFNITVQEGKVTFYSRTRQSLWTKGETSGNFLNVVSMYSDCDNDTLLIKVEPIGPTCHRGTTSCFDTAESEGYIKALEKLVNQRFVEMPEKSYTTSLFKSGVGKMSQKVGEEAIETVIEAMAGNKDAYIYEVCDLIYHLLVLNQGMGVSLKDLEEELVRRHYHPKEV